MRQNGEEILENMISTEEYLKKRQAALPEKMCRNENAEDTVYALKLAVLFYI